MWFCMCGCAGQHVFHSFIGSASGGLQDSKKHRKCTEERPNGGPKKAPESSKRPPAAPRNLDHGPGQLQEAPSSLFGALGARGPAPQEGPREPQEAQERVQDGPQRAQDGVPKAAGRVDGTSSDENVKICFPPRRERGFPGSDGFENGPRSARSGPKAGPEG